MMKIINKRTPHYKKGREAKIQGICVHIADGTAQSVISWFGSPKSAVSSHYLIDRDATTYQFVKDEDVSWGAGKVVRPVATLLMQNSSVNPNEYLLNIENAGFAYEDITEVQYQRNAELVESLCTKHDIPLDNLHIIPHKFVRADKLCPGKIDTARIVRMAQQIRSDRTREATPEEENYYKGIIMDLIQKILNILKGRQSR